MASFNKFPRSIGEGLRFINEHRAILYSLGLLVILPVLLFLHTFFILRNTQSHIDRVIQTKAVLAEEIIGVFSISSLDNPQFIQEKVAQLSHRTGDITELTIAVPLPQQDVFKVIASSDEKIIGSRLTNPLVTLAWSQKTDPAGTVPGVATILTENGKRFWFVSKALIDEQGRKRGLATIALSLSESDALLRATVLRSYLVLALLVSLLILLVAIHGRLFGYVTLFRRVRDLNRLKDEFISMASHELRTPLTAIQGYLAMILSGSLGQMDERVRQALQEVRRVGQNLHDLIEDILDVSRIEQERLELTSEPLDVAEVARATVEQLRPKAEEKKLRYQLEVPTGALPQISLDRKRLRQVLINLLGNAIKYTPAGEVRVKVLYDEFKSEISIKVKDTGVGMSAREREMLFQKFYRIRDEKTRNIAGTGLGLWITKQLVDLMGGRIYVDSLPGQGSEFTVVFPVKPSPEKKQ